MLNYKFLYIINGYDLNLLKIEPALVMKDMFGIEKNISDYY